MKYEVRYQLGGTEHAQEVDADSAASAAKQVQDEHSNTDEMFELIQVQLLDDFVPGQEPTTASNCT